MGVDKSGEEIETTDNQSQLKAVDIALKLQQAYPVTRVDTTIRVGEAPEELRKRIQDNIQKATQKATQKGKPKLKLSQGK